MTRKFIRIEEKVGTPITRTRVNFQDSTLSFAFTTPQKNYKVAGYTYAELDALQSFSGVFGTVEKFEYDPIENKDKRQNVRVTLSNVTIIDAAIDSTITQLNILDEHHAAFKIALKNQNFDTLKTLIPVYHDAQSMSDINTQVSRHVAYALQQQFETIFDNIPEDGLSTIDRKTHTWPDIVLKTQIEYAQQFPLKDEQFNKADKALLRGIIPVYDTLKSQSREAEMTQAYSVILGKTLSKYGLDVGKTYPIEGILGQTREYNAVKTMLEHGISKTTLKNAFHETYTANERNLVIDLMAHQALEGNTLSDANIVILADKLNGTGRTFLNLRTLDMQAIYSTFKNAGFDEINVTMDNKKYTKKEARVIHQAIENNDFTLAAQAMTDLSSTGEDTIRVKGEDKPIPEYTKFEY